ncbi:glycoprotease family protein [Trichoderma barbatum]
MLPPRCHPTTFSRRLTSHGLSSLTRTVFSSRNSIRTRNTQRCNLVTLAIESSCDDTAVAVLEKTAGGKTRLLFNERISSDNRAFKGIHPRVTVEGHNVALGPLVQKALMSLRESEDDVDGVGSGSSVVGTDGKKRRKRGVPDFVCATRGPGIMTNLSVGLNVAKGLALAWDVPLVGVHHMQAHALTPRLVDALEKGEGRQEKEEERPSPSSTPSQPSPSPSFPFLSLLVSGGHTQLILSSSLTTHRILATTADIAIGNLLDQTARVILPPSLLESSPDVMYGRVLESFAFPPGADTPADYDAFFTPAASRQDEMQDVPSGYEWTVPLPFKNSRKLAYSFSSIYTHVHKIAAAAIIRNTNTNSTDQDHDSISSSDMMPLEERRALARHTLRAAFQHLASRLTLALQDSPSLQPSSSSSSTPGNEIKTLVVAGGVASNRFLMHVLRTTLAARGFHDMHIVAPPLELCTDNAAMIAWAGMEMFEAGWRSELSVRPIARWPMDPDVGGGILGAGGWLNEEE